MNASFLKKAHRCRGELATHLARLPAFSGMRRTLSARCQAVARHHVDAEAEHGRERRYQPVTENDGCARLVRSRQSQRNCSRTDDAQPIGHDSPRKSSGLQPFCLDGRPARLRHQKARRSPRMLQNQRLQRPRWIAWPTTDGRQTGALATRSKNRNGDPAAEQGVSETFRHGTKFRAEVIENGDFVPPRYKTRCLGGSHRSATGHLSRFAIYRGISRC